MKLIKNHYLLTGYKHNAILFKEPVRLYSRPSISDQCRHLVTIFVNEFDITQLSQWDESCQLIIETKTESVIEGWTIKKTTCLPNQGRVDWHYKEIIWHNKKDDIYDEFKSEND